MSIGATSNHPPVSKPSGQSYNAHIAMHDDQKLKDKNPLSNANLPGGLFTHPGVNC